MTGYAAFVLLGVLFAATGPAAPARAGIRLAPVQTLFDGTGLAGAIAVVSSPDGRHVYAAGRTDSALVAFSRDAATGLLTPIQVSRDDVGGVDGLLHVLTLAISPDGARVYAGGERENSLTVFARDAATGFLEPVEFQRGETSPMQGLDDLGSVAVSPDSHHIYVTGGFDTVTVFSRDAASGGVSVVEEQRGTHGVEGLIYPDPIAVSPDGKHVYVGTLTGALVIFTRDLQRGSLTATGLLRDGVDGADGLDAIRGLSISPDGRNLYVAASDDDSIAVFDRNSDLGLLTFAQILRDGSGPVRGLDGAYSVAVSSDGKRVYTASADSSSMVVFARHTATGRLEFVEAFVEGDAALDGLGGAHQVAISPDNANVYVAAPVDGAIAIFADRESPRFVAAERNADDSVDGLGGAHAAALSPDGKHLYVAGVSDSAIAVFARDAGTGRLDFVEAYRGAAESDLFPRPSLTVTADGAHLLATAFAPGVSVLRRDPVTGRLSPVQRIDRSVPGTEAEAADAAQYASAIASSPAGDQVFVTSYFRHTLSVFDRQPATGELRFRSALGNEAEGPKNPTSIAIAADGLHVYASGSGDDSVVAFNRDPASGELAVGDVVRDGDDGVVGLRAPTSIALGPDDSTLYVVSGGASQSYADDALAVFERDRDDGRLSFVQALADGIDGVDGLDGASSVAVLPDGSAVFVAGPLDNALAVFTRDPADGRVTFERAVRDGEGGADGLAGATSVTVSQDGRYIYVTGSADNALTVFRLVRDEDMICPGDCTADGSVSIGELTLCVSIALGRGNLDACGACDADASQAVTIGDLILAVTNALNGCP